MKFSLLLLFCLAFALVESSEERDALEDENDPRQRFQYKKCSADADCGGGECCFKVSFAGICQAKRKEGRLCNPKSSCLFSCQDDLECRKTDIDFFKSVYKCMIPDETGSEEDNF